MAKNLVYRRVRGLKATVPSGALSGDPVVVGSLPGVCIDDADANDEATVDFDGVYALDVEGVDDGGNAAIGAGEPVYFTIGDTPKINAKESGTFFGYLAPDSSVGSGATAAVNVFVHPGYVYVAP
ncbi:unnamed protein product [marine sediment metagenome]|uniref:DUF2190 family protein n=1 Tax=marine sediment metagenome TaxID=412755 RepID=X1D5D5_9ZZZZ